MIPETNGRVRSPLLRAFRFPKRTDYLHRMVEDATKKAPVPVLLDLEHCTVDELPVSFARFALFIPIIMHKIRNALIVEDLCSNLLAPVEFSDKSLVLNFISAPVAQEDVNYQRLEFLGDVLLKYYTAISLTAEHLLSAQPISTVVNPNFLPVSIPFSPRHPGRPSFTATRPSSQPLLLFPLLCLNQ
ncbi:hypothetical protein MMC10_003850 [Thelotrema lepadinum]|nr:hypothetical protein [Thelotrema lepadinum]